MGNEASVGEVSPPSPGLLKCPRPLPPRDSVSPIAYGGGGGGASPAVTTSALGCQPPQPWKPVGGGSGTGAGAGGEALPRLGPALTADVLKPAGVVADLPGVLEVFSPLGSGTFSHVFRCRVVGESEPMAVKLCTQAAHIVLAREASLLLGLKHVNLVRLHRVIEGPPVALFLELCEGGELRELLHGAKYTDHIRSIGLKPRVQAWLEVTCALEYLHGKRILHRDISSANCFLARLPEEVPSGAIPQTKLGDLSLARHVDASRLTAGVGSCRYMAPEAMEEEEEYGLPIDIFSCGILAHELCSGQVPYESLTEVAVIISIASGLRPDLEELPAHPKREKAQALIASCWHQEAEARPTANGLVELLRQMVWNMD